MPDNICLECRGSTYRKNDCYTSRGDVKKVPRMIHKTISNFSGSSPTDGRGVVFDK